jgi:mono/diheme cytochrome c family protein
VVLTIVLLVTSCGPSLPDTTADGKPNGEKIYQQQCVNCHGSKGDLGVAGAANLHTSSMTIQDRITIIRNGKGAMNGFSHLSEAEIEAVATYIDELK